jgi:hypothetical protein
VGRCIVGDRLRRTIRPLKKDEREDFDTVLAASLTLLALIIGFSFSMAVSRYDQRKNYEEAEPTPSARNICGQICCPRKTAQGFASL